MVDERGQEPTQPAATTAAPEPAAALPGLTGNEGAAAPGAPAAQPEALIRHDIRFHATADAAYHGMREGFLGGVHRALMALVLIGGTTSFAALTEQIAPAWQQGAAVLVVGAAIIDLIFDLSGKARTHARLRARYHQVLARLHLCGDVDLPALQAELQAIYAEEPPGHRMVQALAHNAAVDAMYEDAKARTLRLTVPWWPDRLFGNILRLSGHVYERRGIQSP